jgi:hypothetical protein
MREKRFVGAAVYKQYSRIFEAKNHILWGCPVSKRVKTERTSDDSI